MEINYVKGDLISLAKAGTYDVIAHGCNSFCTQTRGVAKQFASAFSTADPNIYKLEGPRFKGDINKLGQIEFRTHILAHNPIKSVQPQSLVVVNAYTQYRYGTKEANIDYDALRLCLRKMNVRFKGKHIGLPKIGSDLAGGDWQIIERMIKQELKDCSTTVVLYERERNKTGQECSSTQGSA